MKEITIEKLKELLSQADAISIDDSPMLTDWNLFYDNEALINTKWNEDDQEWECELSEFEIECIKFGGNSFHIYYKKETPTTRVIRVKLFKIQVIGI